MTTQDAVVDRRLQFDVVLDAWPDGAQGKALHSLVASGDVAAVRLPYGFVGLTIVSARMLLYLDAGQLHVRQVLPTVNSGCLLCRPREVQSSIRVAKESWG